MIIEFFFTFVNIIYLNTILHFYGPKHFLKKIAIDKQTICFIYIEMNLLCIFSNLFFAFFNHIMSSSVRFF